MSFLPEDPRPAVAPPSSALPSGPPNGEVAVRRRALERWLARLERRCPLPEADREAVLGFSGRVEQFGSGRDVVPLGERARHACLVADGVLARFGQTTAGTRQFTAFYLPGDMGDLHSVVLPRVTAPLQSALHATLVFVPHEELLAASERSPTLARAFWRDCVADAQVASEWMLNNGRREALSRVAHLLSELAVRYEAAAGARMGTLGDIPMDFTQAQLADATGLTSVHVNRTLRELREAGALAMRERRLELPNRALLEHMGEFDPAYLHLMPEQDASG